MTHRVRWHGRAVCTGVPALLVLLATSAAAQDNRPVLTLDAGLMGTFDNNVDRDPVGLNGYVGAGDLLLRLASRPSRPLLQLEYSASLRRSSDANPADGPGHRFSGLAGVPFASWLRLDVIGRGGRGGVDEDLVSADEIMLLGRLELLPTRSSRLRAYGARRWREPPAGVAPPDEGYAGINLRQRLRGSTTLLLDLRYEDTQPEDTTRSWHRRTAALGIGQSISKSTAFEFAVRRRERLYPLRMVELDDGALVPRRDDDWRLGLALVYDNGRGAELRLEYQHEERTSTDQRRAYDADRVNLTVRHRVFGAGGRRSPPLIDEATAAEALRAREEASASDATASFITVASGGSSVCALATSGVAICWPEFTGAAAPRSAASLRGPWAYLAAGPGRVCALDRDGRTWCWVWQHGVAEEGSRTAVATPQPVRTELRFTTLSVGGEHTCALTADGAAWCWGGNNEGQLGTGNTRASITPVRVDAALPFRTISAGSRHTCALTEDDTVFCWGANESSQAGAGPLRQALAPRQIPGLRLSDISAGTRHSCGVAADGGVWCWGDNISAQSGQTASVRFLPAPQRIASVTPFRTVSAGWAHTCALDLDGGAWCWGRDGDRRTTPASDADLAGDHVPTAVGTRAFSSITASTGTCALDLEHRVHCWRGFPAGAAAITNDQGRPTLPAGRTRR